MNKPLLFTQQSLWSTEALDTICQTLPLHSVLSKTNVSTLVLRLSCMSPRLAPSIVKPFGEWGRGWFFPGSSVRNLPSMWVGCRQLPEWRIRV